MRVTESLRRPDASGTRAARGLLTRSGLFENSFRLSPKPFPLNSEELSVLEWLGPLLLDFYRAVNRLYLDSVRGSVPGWVAAYFEAGKPKELIETSRYGRFKHHLPLVIRPDLVLTESGFALTELDPVPGGIGLTALLARAYGDRVIGGEEGMIDGFASAMEEAAGKPRPALAIVVSEESRDYRPEMRWLAGALREKGWNAVAVAPEELKFLDGEVLAPFPDGPARVEVVYRFFELFDLPNIAGIDPLVAAVKQRGVVITPPLKPYLEEKLALALLHHPLLEPFWTDTLGPEGYRRLQKIVPKSWIIDPRPVPPHAVIPGLTSGGKAIADFTLLAHEGKRERERVLKPSGFSELAWGSRGVIVGHDLSEEEWGKAIERALASFPKSPYVLQDFHKGKKVTVEYEEEPSGRMVAMEGRARISPYYFLANGGAHLCGVLATICPADKKLLHGMVDAVMAPAALEGFDR